MEQSSEAEPGALDTQSSGSGEDPAKGMEKEQPVHEEKSQQREASGSLLQRVPGAVEGPFRYLTS